MNGTILTRNTDAEYPYTDIYTTAVYKKKIPLARVLAKTLIINLNKVVVTKIPNPQKGTEIRSINM